jgi:hypothetical protein
MLDSFRNLNYMSIACSTETKYPWKHIHQINTVQSPNNNGIPTEEPPLQKSHQANIIKRPTDNDLNQHCRSNNLNHTIVVSYYLKQKNMQAFVISLKIVNAYKREPIIWEIINYQKVLLILMWCSNDNIWLILSETEILCRHLLLPPT